MKVSGGYKFTLQFSGRLPTHRRVGEFLNQLGNKKSEFIIPIISAYLDQHPEYERGEREAVPSFEEFPNISRTQVSQQPINPTKEIGHTRNALSAMLDCIDGL